MTRTADTEPTRGSIWPVLLVLGGILALLGFVLGGTWLVLAAIGLVGFGVSVVGLVHETGYAATYWVPALTVTTTYAFVSTFILTATGDESTAVALVGAALMFGVGTIAAYAVETGWV